MKNITRVLIVAILMVAVAGTTWYSASLYYAPKEEKPIRIGVLPYSPLNQAPPGHDVCPS